MAVATSPELARTPSVHVTLGHNGPDGYGASKVETYFRFSVEWRGQTVAVDATADTYRHSSGWSDQRVIVYRTDPHVTDTARAAIREAVAPIALDWILYGDEYVPAHKRAHAKAIARELRDERYSTEGVRRLIAALDLESDDRANLTRAADLTDERTALLDTIGAS